MRYNWLIQSRLDSFKFSGKGRWLEEIVELQHEGGFALSDHDPLSGNVSTWQTVPFFKANSAIL